MTAAFHRGLKEVGYVEGQNVEVVYRYADGQYDRLPSLVADLVRRQVALIGALARLPRRRLRQQPLRYRSFLRVPIRSSTVWWLASIDLVAMPPVCTL